MAYIGRMRAKIATCDTTNNADGMRNSRIDATYFVEGAGEVAVVFAGGAVLLGAVRSGAVTGGFEETMLGPVGERSKKVKYTSAAEARTMMTPITAARELPVLRKYWRSNFPSLGRL
jgi:hypothetical protein